MVATGLVAPLWKLMDFPHQLSLVRCTLFRGCPDLADCQLWFMLRWRGHHCCQVCVKIVSSCFFCSAAGLHFWVTCPWRGFCIAVRLITPKPQSFCKFVLAGCSAARTTRVRLDPWRTDDTGFLPARSFVHDLLEVCCKHSRGQLHACRYHATREVSTIISNDLKRVAKLSRRTSLSPVPRPATPRDQRCELVVVPR